jgi:molybdate transport system ATP-binding protein
MAEGLHVAAVVDNGTFRLDVAFTVAPGEVLGVLGPNGAGKSTLLRALAGLIALTDGAITLGDTAIDVPNDDVFVPAERRPIGLVFQDYRLFPHLTVRDNIAFAPRSRGRRRDARAAADRWLQRLDLVEFAERKPGQLSGGQAQRVALARALAAEPELLLLDEPLAALDARTRLDVRATLTKQLRAFPKPTLLVTHDPLDAMVMTDRLLVIEDGRVVQAGSPAEVARRPATQYVARLVGLNLYAGDRAADGRVELHDGGVLIATGTDDRPAPTGPVLIALRPSAVALHTSAPLDASPRNVWSGTVTGLELLTDRVRVRVESTPTVLVDVTAAAVAELRLVEGDVVWMSAKATDIDVYANNGSLT